MGMKIKRHCLFGLSVCLSVCLYLSQSVCLSICLSVRTSVSLSGCFLQLCRSVSLSDRRNFIFSVFQTCLSFRVPICLSVCPPISPSARLSTHCLLVFLCVHLSDGRPFGLIPFSALAWAAFCLSILSISICFCHLSISLLNALSAIFLFDKKQIFLKRSAHLYQKHAICFGMQICSLSLFHSIPLFTALLSLFHH